MFRSCGSQQRKNCNIVYIPLLGCHHKYNYTLLRSACNIKGQAHGFTVLSGQFIIYAAVKDYITELLIIYDFLVGVYMYMYACVYNTAASNE